MMLFAFLIRMNDINKWQDVSLNLILNLPERINQNRAFIILFRSTFCARCMVNHKYFEEERKFYSKIQIETINIAHEEFNFMKLMIRIAPSTLIVFKKRIFYFKENILSREEVRSILELTDKLIKISEI